MNSDEAARRTDKYLRTLNPRDLWPDVTERAFAGPIAEIARIATALLAEPGSRAALNERAAGTTATLTAALGASCTGPLLGYWVACGRLDVPPNVAALLAQQLEHGRARAHRLGDALARVLDILSEVGVSGVVLKGMHTGHVYFPDPGCRPCGDIDVLIARESVPAAHRALSAHGFVADPLSPLGRTSWTPAERSSVVSVDFPSADNPWTLDLHWTLDRRVKETEMAVFGALEAGDLQPWAVGSRRVQALRQPLLTAYLAVHASDHLVALPLLRLVELVMVARRDRGRDLDWHACLDRLKRAAPFAYPALDLAERLSPGTVDAEVLNRLRAQVPARVRQFVDRIAPSTAQQLYRRSYEGRFVWTTSSRQRLASLIKWLWPRRSDGTRLPTRVALRVTGQRLRRLLAGRLSWRHR